MFFHNLLIKNNNSYYVMILTFMSLLTNRHIQSFASTEGTGIQKASGNIKQLLPVFHSHARTHPCDAGVNISQMQIGVPEAEFQRPAVIRLQENIRDGLQALLSWQINANFRSSLVADYQVKSCSNREHCQIKSALMHLKGMSGLFAARPAVCEFS
ncbi:hypothetical protein KCQ_19202 [Pectobacterium atrosepticum ICMP 1526]|nr:hypothetical protein [Pectobacterium atrosepticum]KFX16430.1 hypothetical protein JV34_06500 [Pectobacterium atrosepticum]KMK79523.1 hypothetical protein KCQ_19202 [Pectobacterium atrosepticum ICMP 1526]MBQ4795115.1 hypothetical protein [Pectobacterium versatile]QXE16895.1 hypothetical protein DCX48_21700 [Pectobacterium atrosepticum]